MTKTVTAMNLAAGDRIKGRTVRIVTEDYDISGRAYIAVYFTDSEGEFDYMSLPGWDYEVEIEDR